MNLKINKIKTASICESLGMMIHTNVKTLSKAIELEKPTTIASCIATIEDQMRRLQENLNHLKNETK